MYRFESLYIFSFYGIMCMVIQMKELSYYDGRLIRLTDASGAVYEGICAHNSADYNEHEFGVYEEGIEIFHFLFYKKLKRFRSFQHHTD